MLLNLRKTEYDQIETTKNHCAILIPPNVQSTTWRFVVADASNKVHIYEYKNQENHIVFRIKNPIIRICLEEAQVAKQRYRLFISHGTRISIYSIKGKQLMEYSSNIDGTISSMAIVQSGIYIATEAIYQKLINWEEKEFLLCADKITDILVLDRVFECSIPLVLLSCVDRMLRVLKKGILFAELEVPGPPTCLANANLHLRSDHVIYGTSDGKFGLVQLSSGVPAHRWELCSQNTRNAVLSIEHYGLLREKQEQLIVAYEDGVIEVYTYDEFDYPTLIYETKISQKLTAVCAGNFAHADFPELVCVTYSGTIFGLTTEPVVEEETTDIERSSGTNFQAKIEKLEDDIKNLEEQLHQIRSAVVSGSNVNLLTLASLQLVHSFNLDTELSAYCLKLESPVSIDHVLVQCDCPIDLLDQDDGTAIRSDTQLNFEDRNVVLTTFRCQANTTHLTLYMRTVEGQFGVLRVYVAPRSDGPIACKQLEFPIRPLSLHRRTHTFPEDCERPLNRLTLSGRFSLAEMHQWVQVCLPETPDKPPIVTEEATGIKETMETGDEEHVRLIYESTFIGSKLECCYKKQQATFRSDNISTIAILKDVLTKEATKRKIILSLDIDIHPDSVEYTLRTIHPKLESLIILVRKVGLITPLQELVSSQSHNFSSSGARMKGSTTRNDNPLPGSLPADYAAIWREASSLQALYKQHPCTLERLYGCIVDLYIDKYRFQGDDVRARVPGLLEVLKHYDFHRILQYFNEH